MASDPPDPGPSDQIHSIAAVLASALPAAGVDRMLDDHVADSTGHCRGCRSPTTASPVWPCRIWEIGHETSRLRRAARRP